MKQQIVTSLKKVHWILCVNHLVVSKQDHLASLPVSFRKSSDVGHVRETASVKVGGYWIHLLTYQPYQVWDLWQYSLAYQIHVIIQNCSKKNCNASKHRLVCTHSLPSRWYMIVLSEADTQPNCRCIIIIFNICLETKEVKGGIKSPDSNPKFC